MATSANVSGGSIPPARADVSPGCEGIFPKSCSVIRVKRVAGLVVLLVLALLLPIERVAATTIDGQFDQTGPLSGGSIFNLAILGRGGVPSGGVGSVALNVTVTNPTAAGFLTVWPTGQPRPTASNLNYVAAQTVPNMVIVPLGPGGQISIFASAGTTDVIVDVLGWFPSGSSFVGLTPARLMDSRPGAATADGAFAGGGKIVGGVAAGLSVVARGGVPSAGAGSVALNVTVTNPTVAGFLTVWPAGQPQPTASNLNFVPGQTVPNMVIVPLGAAGDLSIFASGGTADVIVDVLGWFPTGPSFTGLTPARLMDSRPGSATVDGNFAGGGKLGAAAPMNLGVLGRGGVPFGGVGSVALNVTVTNPTVAGYLTVWPAGQPQPTASNLNFVPGQTVPNMVIVPLGAGGQVSIFSSAGTTDVIVDVLGWFPADSSFTGLTPARLMDSRLPPPPPPPPPPPAPLTFSPGTHLINTDMPPGRYVAANAISGCYWERESGLGGTFAEIIANDFQGFKGRSIVDIQGSDVAFKFNGSCGTFKSYTAPAAPVPAIVPGAYVIGAHMLAGTYTTNAASGCYWARLSSFDGEGHSIIANDFVSTAGTQFVTINPSDIGFTTDAECGTWSPA